MGSSVIAGVLAAAPVAATEIYRSVNEDGVVEFSDRPGAGREPVEVDPAIGAEPAPAPDGERALERPGEDSSATLPEEAAAEVVDYDTLVITSPEHDQAFYRNQPDLPVQVNLEPELAEDHAFVAWLDGQRVDQRFATPAFSIEPVHPGEHQLRVAVVDDEGEIQIESETITFYRLRHTIGN